MCSLYDHLGPDAAVSVCCVEVQCEEMLDLLAPRICAATHPQQQSPNGNGGAGGTPRGGVSRSPSVRSQPLTVVVAASPDEALALLKVRGGGG